MRVFSAWIIIISCFAFGLNTLEPVNSSASTGKRKRAHQPDPGSQSKRVNNQGSVAADSGQPRPAFVDEIMAAFNQMQTNVLDRINQRFDQQDQRINELGNRVSAVESTLNSLRNTNYRSDTPSSPIDAETLQFNSLPASNIDNSFADPISSDHRDSAQPPPQNVISIGPNHSATTSPTITQNTDHEIPSAFFGLGRANPDSHPVTIQAQVIHPPDETSLRNAHTTNALQITPLRLQATELLGRIFPKTDRHWRLFVEKKLVKTGGIDELIKSGNISILDQLDRRNSGAKNLEIMLT